MPALHPANKIIDLSRLFPRQFSYYHLETSIKSLRSPKNVILHHEARLERHMTAHMGARPLRGAQHLLVAERGRSRVGFALVSGPGAPPMALALEELAAMGTKRVILVGFAKALQPDLQAGSIVLCSRAIRGENTSFHYTAYSKYSYPDATINRVIAAELERGGIGFRKGSSWSTDAPFRVNPTQSHRFRREGVLTVEMEASALFAVARTLSMDAAALFSVSEAPLSEGREPHTTRAMLELERILGLSASLFPPDSFLL